MKKRNGTLPSDSIFHLMLLLIGVVIIGASAVIGAKISFEGAESTLNRTLTYMKKQCAGYEALMSLDEVKSLVRISEQAEEVRNDLLLDPETMNEEYLRFYAKNQRLECVMILDGEGEPELGYCSETPVCGNWSDFFKKQQIRDVLNYPEKIYTERIESEGQTYDIAVTSRQDAPGAVFCSRLQDRGVLDAYQSTVKSLLAGYEMVLNGTLFITDGNKIINSNYDGPEGQRSGQAELLDEIDRSAGDGELIRLKTGSEVYYGGKSQYQGYHLYIVYPALSVFSLCHKVIIVVFAIYSAVMVLVVLLHEKTRRTHLALLNSQTETVRAISRIYISSILVDIMQNKLEFLYCPGLPDSPDGIPADILFCEHMAKRVDPSYRNEYRHFTDMHTVSQRLKGREYIEFAYPGTDGIWYMDTIIPRDTDEKVNVKTIVVVTKNIDEQKKTELNYRKELEESVRKISTANEAKTEFLRRISHDIRTPINVILGMTEMGNRHSQDPEQLRYYRQKTREAAEFLLEFVNDILTLNRLDSGIQQQPRKFDLESETNEIISMVLPQAERMGVRVLSPEFSLKHTEFIGIPLYYRQILMNILSNAVKYNRKDGTVSISLAETGASAGKTEVHITCADTGTGMSKDFQKKMFEPFARESEENENVYGGIGLGLSVVRKLVDKMGGQIGVESEKDRGTKFDITLPLEYCQPEEEYQPSDERPSIAGMKILLVEDNKLNMEIAESLLTDDGAEVTKAFSGEEGLRLFSGSEPGYFDLILMDVMMPGTDGLQATRAIRSMNRTDAGEVPILAITAALFEEDLRECLEAGMNGWVPKPLDTEKLAREISDQVKKRRDRNK